MPVPAFGFSVGDFVAALQLVRKVSQALSDSGGAVKDYQALATELKMLQGVLEQLRDLPTTFSSSQNPYNALQVMVHETQLPLGAFVEKMRVYYDHLGPSADIKSWKSKKWKIQWTMSMREEVRLMRAAMTMKILSLSVLMAIPTSDTLSRIERRLISCDDVARSESSRLYDGIEQVLSGQELIKDYVKTSTLQIQELHSETGRLLRICMGLAAGVQRLEDHQTSQNREKSFQNQTIAHQQPRTRLAMKKMSYSIEALQTYAAKTTKMVGRLLKLFSNFSKDILHYIERLHVSNIEIHNMLVQIHKTTLRPIENPLENNIKFIDVLYRESSLPYVYFRHWQVFEAMLVCQFQGSPGEHKVRHGRYLIFNGKIPGEVITKEDWPKLVFPGSEIHMSVRLCWTTKVGSRCPRPRCSGKASHAVAKIAKLVKCDQCDLQFNTHNTTAFGDYGGENHYDIDWEIYSHYTRAAFQRDFGSMRNGINPWVFRHLVISSNGSEAPRRKRRMDSKTRKSQAQQDLRVLRGLILAFVRLKKLVNQLRQREEEELRAFRVVHIDTQAPRNLRLRIYKNKRVRKRNSHATEVKGSASDHPFNVSSA